MMTYALLGATFAMAGIAQPGALQAYLLSHAAAHGWRRTLPAALAPPISDIPVVLMAVLVLSRLPVWFAPWLRLAGGAFVLYLAFGAFRTFRNLGRAAGSGPASGSRTLAKACLVNLMNPNPWIGWSLVLGPLLIRAWREGPLHAAAMLAGFYGVFVPGLAGVIVVFGVSAGLGHRVRRALMGFSVLALTGFAAYLLWSGAAGLR